MTRDDIVRMAQEAAIMPPNWGATEAQWRSLEAFAELVAQTEREACAALVEDMDGCCQYFPHVSEAIRARSNDAP